MVVQNRRLNLQFIVFKVAHHELALRRYNRNSVRPHLSLGDQTYTEARRTLEKFDNAAPGALAQANDEEYANHPR